MVFPPPELAYSINASCQFTLTYILISQPFFLIFKCVKCIKSQI